MKEKPFLKSSENPAENCSSCVRRASPACKPSGRPGSPTVQLSWARGDGPQLPAQHSKHDCSLWEGSFCLASAPPSPSPALLSGRPEPWKSEGRWQLSCLPLWVWTGHPGWKKMGFAASGHLLLC